jgi:3-hydroxyacyl-CoA dehydrogenase
MIHYQIVDGVAIIIMSSAPVNALGLAMRQALVEHLQLAIAVDQVKAVVISSNLALFCGGADIKEFETGELLDAPNLPDVIDAFENAPKLVIAAIKGSAMGGGLELALGCDYRIALESAKMGLPEIKLGLLPGAGGTQRLPRIAGLPQALDMILSGNPISAQQAHDQGLVDRVVGRDADLLGAALEYAGELIAADAPKALCADIVVEQSGIGSDFFDQTRSAIAQKTAGQVAPEACIQSLERSTSLPLADALKADVEAFENLLETPQARALIHLFFAEREAQKIPGVTSDTPVREITSVAVIGAGTMGVGIAIACLDAGFDVTILEMSAEALDRGLGNLQKHYDRMVEKGRINESRAQQCKSAVTGTLDYADLGGADLVIEAVFEDLAIKKKVFEQLDQVCKPGAILASNTSTLDLNAIAGFTGRPADVIGLHFFSPANIMRLLEIVRGDKTSADVIKSALVFGKHIRKLPVVVGVCYGFVGNRMLEPYFREGSRLLLEGASPEQVDNVLTGFGMAMGIISVADLAGIDVSYRVRESRRDAISHDPAYQAIQDKLYELGRYGQKTGRGSYFYEGREKRNDPEVIALCEQLAAKNGIERRQITDKEILGRCLYPLINEGIQILDEGIAYRSGDCDLIWVNGYGFPAWRGGPLQYADEIGLDTVLTGMNHYRETLGGYGEMWFKPSPLLERLAFDRVKLAEFIPPSNH